MPWPWETTPAKKPFPPAPNGPVVTPKVTPDGRSNKAVIDAISGKKGKKTRDEIIAEQGG